MSSYIVGHSWLHQRSQYRKKFGIDVPQWVLVLDLPKKLRLITVALRIQMVLPQEVLVANEFHN
jgi:hypothetical protein